MIYEMILNIRIILNIFRRVQWIIICLRCITFTVARHSIVFAKLT